jgi:hypothetical protein
MSRVPSPRVRDLAVLWLASLGGPPRQRPRDAQADLAGIALLRELLDRLIALDPEPGEVEAALLRIVSERGEPTGPSRSLAAQVLAEYRAFAQSPQAWSWLVAEAVQAAAEDRPRKSQRSVWRAPDRHAVDLESETAHGSS